MRTITLSAVAKMDGAEIVGYNLDLLLFNQAKVACMFILH